MENMGGTCSLNRVRRRKSDDQVDKNVEEQPANMESGLNNHMGNCRHSVDVEIPDKSIASFYPVEDNYDIDDGGNTRSPKSLVDLCVGSICRNLTEYDGELPEGLPQELVDQILSSLVSHSALNATTLKALRKCELGALPLFRCRGVTDEWLRSLTTSQFVITSGSSHAVPIAPDMMGNMYRPQLESFRNSEDEMSMKSSSSSSQSSYHSAFSSSMPRKIDPKNDHLQFSSSPEPLFQNGKNSLLEIDMAQQSFDANRITFMSGIGNSVTAQMTVLDLRGSQKLSDKGLLQLKDLHSLEIIRLDDCFSIVGRGFIAFSRAQNLHTLTATNCRRLTDEAITNISHLTSLFTVNLGGCRCLTDISLRGLRNLLNLRQLDLSQCDLITDDGIGYLATVNYLEELSLGWCRSISDNGIEVLCKQVGREKLQTLCLARCQITDSGIRHLSNLKSLKSLDLNGCVGISSSGLGSTLGTIPQLETIDVSYCPGILRSSWQGKINALKSLDLCYSSVKDVHLSRLTHLPSLEELNIDSCPVGDWSMAHLADGVVPNLLSLNLADCDISDLAMVHIAKFKNLNHLSLFYCNISNHGLRYISGMASLESLNLDSRDISDDGLYHLRKLVNLKCLDIFSGRISDIGCVHLGKIKSLERLELCGGGIGDLGCTHLVENLPNLTSLNLAQNEQITNIGASAISSLVNLKSLNLSNTRVNTNALVFFKGLRQLQSLAMYGCRGVENSDNGIYNLQTELPNLKCLRLGGTSGDDGTTVIANNIAVDAHADDSSSSDSEDDMASDNDGEFSEGGADFETIGIDVEEDNQMQE
jgi:Leucine-rich repeat (LRR) protein